MNFDNWIYILHTHCVTAELYMCIILITPLSECTKFPRTISTHSLEPPLSMENFVFSFRFFITEWCWCCCSTMLQDESWWIYAVLCFHNSIECESIVNIINIISKRLWLSSILLSAMKEWRRIPNILQSNFKKLSVNWTVEAVV